MGAYGHKRTLIDELIVAQKATVWYRPVRLKDKLDTLMYHDDRQGLYDPADALLQVHHAFNIDSKDIHVVEKTSTNIKSYLQWPKLTIPVCLTDLTDYTCANIKYTEEGIVETIRFT